MEYLTQIDLQTFNQYVIYWGALGFLSALAIHFLKLLPISSRADNSVLGFLGNIDKKLGWIIMEVPVLIVVIYFYATGKNPINVSIVMVGVFVFHYINRALIYPYRIKAAGKTMAVSMMLSSMTFYIINGYVIGYYFGTLKEYPIEWLWDPRFIVGLVLFMTGFIINVTSDNILMNLRSPGETGYKIPHGGFFKYVSCPNYFGEILEWIGFAVMTWCLPGVIYAVWVALPLFAQALGAHRWYVEKFADEYPANRKAIIPGLI